MIWLLARSGFCQPFVTCPSHFMSGKIVTKMSKYQNVSGYLQRLFVREVSQFKTGVHIYIYKAERIKPKQSGDCRQCLSASVYHSPALSRRQEARLSRQSRGARPLFDQHNSCLCKLNICSKNNLSRGCEGTLSSLITEYTSDTTL